MQKVISRGMRFRLSPSNLVLLEDCPRCFWLHVIKKIRRPSGPVPSISIKMDSIIKRYFDRYRREGRLPPIIEGKIKGKLASNMPKTLQHIENEHIILWGRPDEYIVTDDETIIALDHKTKSKEPDVIPSAYKLQLDVYSYLLKNNGYKTANKAYLAFYYPSESEIHEGMNIKCSVIEVETDPSRVKKLVKRATEILMGPMPEASENCEYCKWLNEVNQRINERKKIKKVYQVKPLWLFG